jgi:hypothetical protein
MKKFVWTALAAAGLLVAFSLPAHAWHGGHFRGSIWIGPGWGPVYPYWYPGPPVVVERPVIIPEQPPVYVEPAPSREEESYWYYCPDKQGYYPYVKKCPKGWLKVVPAPAPPDADQGEE